MKDTTEATFPALLRKRADDDGDRFAHDEACDCTECYLRKAAAALDAKDAEIVILKQAAIDDQHEIDRLRTAISDLDTLYTAGADIDRTLSELVESIES